MAKKNIGLSTSIQALQSRVIELEAELKQHEWQDSMAAISLYNILMLVSDDTKYLENIGFKKPLETVDEIAGLMLKSLAENGCKTAQTGKVTLPEVE